MRMTRFQTQNDPPKEAACLDRLNGKLVGLSPASFYLLMGDTEGWPAIHANGDGGGIDANNGAGLRVLVIPPDPDVAIHASARFQGGDETVVFGGCHQEFPLPEWFMGLPHYRTRSQVA